MVMNRAGLAKIWSVVAAMLLHAGASARAQPATPLQSFYVHSLIVSGEQIVDVSQQGLDVRVRTITMEGVSDHCPGWVVAAHDQVLVNTTVQAIAGAPLCSITERRHTRAVGKSRRKGNASSIDFLGWHGAVVASCAGQERRFPFVQEPGDQLDPAKLLNRDPDVYKVWTLTLAATEGTLGRGPAETPDQQTREAFGTTIVPDLVGGKYEAAFRDACWNEARKGTVPCEPNYFAWRLEGYTGPPAQRGPLPLRLVDHDKWQFVSYVPPVFPHIALSARVFGDVHLRLEVDGDSGAVTAATVTKGRPLLDDAALAAAKRWRFVPGSTPPGAFDVAVRFQVECPAR